MRWLLGGLLLAAWTRCGPARSIDGSAPITSPTASDWQLRWLDANRLELAPGVVLNVNNQTVFGGELLWDGEKVLDDRRPPATAVRAPDGSRAWLTGADTLCVAHAADPRCPEDIEAVTRCARLTPKPHLTTPVPRTDPLTSALRGRPTIALDHRGLKPDDRGCSSWQVTIPDGKAPVLTRRDREGSDWVEIGHDIVETETGYQWSWLKHFSRSHFDVYRPAVDDGRDSCPTDGKSGYKPAFTSVLCYAPLGTWSAETDDEIRLSELVIYKSLDACHRAVGAKLAAGVPGCGGNAKTASLRLSEQP